MRRSAGVNADSGGVVAARVTGALTQIRQQRVDGPFVAA
jgi:hypothetical protein